MRRPSSFYVVPMLLSATVVSSFTRTPGTTVTIPQQRPLLRQVLYARTAVDDGETINITMHEHRPSLGCTVEESLAGGGLVFVSSVKGHAEAAGLQVGDVVIGVTGLFGKLEMVEGLGLEKVRMCIASRDDDEPLRLCVSRGTSVLAEHEATLAELCADPDKSDEETEQCVIDFLAAGYYTVDDTAESPNVVETTEDSSDQMVEEMQSFWAQEWLPDEPQPVDKHVEESANDSKPKPWSSRSSPSGTFVRDPNTGEMRNIDA